MSPWSRPLTGRGTRFPRVSGDEPGIQAVWTGIQTFSPRERG